jgi:hypothetical protein
MNDIDLHQALNYVWLCIDARYLQHQKEWSTKTFGPGERNEGVTDHIIKELQEIKDSDDPYEWIDVIILALDGAWRAGLEPEEIIRAIHAKQRENELRSWPDWRTAEPGKAIEHIRSL